MGIESVANKVHWNYFLALERDLETAARYVEFAEANMTTYSIEFAHLLFAAASEADVVAKLLCKCVAVDMPRGNIDQYRAALAQNLPEIISTKVLVPRYGLTLSPWSNWANEKNPDWWRSYNNVKHERDSHYAEATLKNALNSLAGLMVLVLHQYSSTPLAPGVKLDRRETTRYLLPESTLLRFPESYYYDVLICG
ncbi:hypothetical protein HEP73_00052 [Xanthomonas sp. GW]|uniref:hypothetical protein n=1 Tax=Xanthomonas sp. GW TaxID=2724121 RepID=UPI001639E10C|nr:hypothetical protein [Xanthomonas sp. GW]QNH19166.1 hypothetical protein HEP73_00052 [Xanthomonas sp. GW]